MWSDGEKEKERFLREDRGGKIQKEEGGGKLHNDISGWKKSQEIILLLT